MIGRLSGKYESNNDIACISGGEGDMGGRSYGIHQFSSLMGVADNFAAWLADKYQFGYIHQYQAGSELFSRAWQDIAAQYPIDFEEAQHEYCIEQYYDPAIGLLAVAGFHVEKHSIAMQEVILSRAVQYGCGYIVEMFEDACKSIGYENLSYVDDVSFDEQMIKAIYLNVCKSEEWTSGSPALREGLYARFESECEDALTILKVGEIT